MIAAVWAIELVSLSSRMGDYRREGLHCYTVLVIIDGEDGHITQHTIHNLSQNYFIFTLHF